MPSKFLVTATALVLAALSLVFLFAPGEVLSNLGERSDALSALPPPPGALLVAQLYAAALLGLAGFNWVSRREIACGNPSCTLPQTNFIHFTAGTLILIKPLLRAPAPPLLGGFGAYALFALLYAWVLWGPKRG